MILNSLYDSINQLQLSQDAQRAAEYFLQPNGRKKESHTSCLQFAARAERAQSPFNSPPTAKHLPTPLDYR